MQKILGNDSLKLKKGPSYEHIPIFLPEKLHSFKRESEN